MRSYIGNMLINKNFMGLDGRYCPIEKFLLMHACEFANIDVCNYLKLSKELIASGETLLQPTGNLQPTYLLIWYLFLHLLKYAS